MKWIKTALYVVATITIGVALLGIALPLTINYIDRVTDAGYDAAEQKLLLNMSKHSLVRFRNESYTPVRYDFETHKVLLRGEKGEIVVSINRIDSI